jgi:alkyl sulfatase BDS1-like metallo-beta-lactamase superfamily hydrolase
MFEKKLHRVSDEVWCAVGFGMANSVMIVARDGLIVVDTGDGLEEASDHRTEFRKVSDAPVRAVLYSHSHYAHGTGLWRDEAGAGLEIWGHAKLSANLADVAAEIGPAYARRAMAQFGFFLPAEGPDAMPNQGIGPIFFHKDRPTTPRHVPPNRIVSEECEVTIAGERVHFVPAPSDSDDTLIIHLPDRRCVINNHIWPVLFNIYTLRGEPYRDPLAHIRAIDRIREMDPEHLVGVHGTPISGREQVRQALADHRDSLQFIWDQTVRGINDGLTLGEIVERVRLPERLLESPFVPQLYGEVPYHVRAIHSGLMGWFDMDAVNLHPLPPQEEARRMVSGFGGRESMLRAAQDALDARDWSWSAQLATYLLRSDAADARARQLKSEALRGRARSTTAANTRSVCLTQALELEGHVDTRAATPWRPNRFRVSTAPPARFVEALKVKLDPERAAEVDSVLAIHFIDRDLTCGLHVFRGVARFLGAEPARRDLRLSLSHATWAELVSGRTKLVAAVHAGAAEVSPSAEAVAAFFRLFDHASVD